MHTDHNVAQPDFERTWLTDVLHMTYAEGSYVLRQARRAEDDALVKAATIISCQNGVAIVERTGWKNERLPDYPVRVSYG